MKTKLILNLLIKKKIMCSTLAEHRKQPHIICVTNNYLELNHWIQKTL